MTQGPGADSTRDVAFICLVCRSWERPIKHYIYLLLIYQQPCERKHEYLAMRQDTMNHICFHVVRFSRCDNHLRNSGLIPMFKMTISLITNTNVFFLFFFFSLLLKCFKVISSADTDGMTVPFATPLFFWLHTPIFFGCCTPSLLVTAPLVCWLFHL